MGTPPMFCVCTGMIGLTGEWRVCRGMIGLRGCKSEGGAKEEGVDRSEMAQEQRPRSITGEA